MMNQENRNYYRARVEQELAAASLAADPRIEAIHRALADRYLLLAGGPAVSLVTPVRADTNVGRADDASNFHQSLQSGRA